MYHVPNKAPLVVGESLVPAVIPILRDLGVEDEVKSFSTYKPGACFYVTDDLTLAFSFDETRGALPPYAYNVPRHEFDETLRRAAEKHGVSVVEQRIELQASAGTVKLLNADQPDLLVDATGRTRLVSNLLKLETVRGDRQDAVLFAHVDETPLHAPGYVHTDRLAHGWSWRIPLPHAVSLGMVMPEKELAEFGDTPEEQYDALLKREPTLQRRIGSAKRITPVLRFANYQLVTKTLYGPGWALLGDSAGFIDPVFSSGLYVALDSAKALASAAERGTEVAFKTYARHVHEHLANWLTVIAYFYDGRLFTSFKVGQDFQHTPVGKLLAPHISKHMARIFTGAAVRSRYSLGLLKLLATHGLRNLDPNDLRIR